MLTVNFPALPSYFLGEEAIIRKYKFWDELKNLLTRKCYLYPVVYTDGLISYVASDGNTRTPYGFALGDYIIPFAAPKDEMTPVQARFHCKKVIFANIKGELPSMQILRYLRSNIRYINKMIDAFDGDIFQEAPYLTDEKSGIDTYVAINFARGYLPLCSINHANNETALCRPMINIAHLY